MASFVLILADAEHTCAHTGQLSWGAHTYRGFVGCSCGRFPGQPFVTGQLSAITEDAGTTVCSFSLSCGKNPWCCWHPKWGKTPKTHTKLNISVRGLEVGACPTLGHNEVKERCCWWFSVRPQWQETEQAQHSYFLNN